MTATLVDNAGRVDRATRFVIALHDARDPIAVGGKAATLAKLVETRITVPPGIVLTTAAFDAHLEAGGAWQDVERILRDVDVRNTVDLARASQALRELVGSIPLSIAVRDELTRAARPLLGLGEVVVRSSAVGEDSALGSFAGQLDSILHVDSEAALERAVLSCWASYWSERALFYRSARGVPLRGMGVIVQRQVQAQCAGVLFTDDGEGSVIIEYVAGLANRLVAGEEDPGRIRIERLSGAVRTDVELGETDKIIRACGREFHSLATQLEKTLGGPQDVEWVIDAAGVVQVVQSRPITAVVRRPTHPPAATPAARPSPRVAWSNANVNENFPHPISPFLYSIASQGYTHYFRNLARGFGISRRRIDAMEPALGCIIGVHGARMYYNLTSIHRVLRLAPFGGALASAFDTFVGANGHDRTDAEHPDVPAGTLRQLVELCVMAARTTWQYLFLRRRIERFERTADDFALATTPNRLASKSLGELRAALAGFMDIRCHRWNDAALADAAAMVCYTALARLLRRAYPSGDVAPQTVLLKAIPNVVSSRPAHELWDLSRVIRADASLAALFEEHDAAAILHAIDLDERHAHFRAAFHRYLDDWGFRCSGELMLTVPSFQEAPGPIIEMLRAYARVDAGSPSDAQARQAEERERETSRMLEELVGRPLVGRVPAPTYANALRVLLGWTHAAIRFRERARLKQALLYSRCRRIALALGAELERRGFLDRPDDIFWLSVSEVDELAAGAAMFPHRVRDLVSLRARTHAELAAFNPPASFEIGEGEYLAAEHRDQAAAPTDDDSRMLPGTAACGGLVTARATVLADMSEAARLERGDVLVTGQTDPGWAPAFFLVSGLVVERGGMLSHGAIVAREFGIPCVVGVRGATSRIQSGSIVTVDGDAGRVHLA